MNGNLAGSKNGQAVPRLLKRALDLSAASALLIFFLPVALPLGLLLRRTGPNLVTRGEEVMGLEGRNFYRWRWAIDPAENTRWMGRLLLKDLSLLPALINVLVGDMAIVGPVARTPRQHQALKHFAADSDLLLSMRPGLIGASAIAHHHGTWSEVRHELDYVDNWNTAIDLKVVWHRLLSYPFAHDSLL